MVLNPRTEPPRLALRPRDAAAALSVSERTLWALTNDGVIPHVRLGRRILYPVATLEAFLASAAASTGGVVAKGA